MKWFVGACLLLLVALALDLGLMAYAMYVLLSLLVASRLLTETWISGLHAQRQTSQIIADIGDTVAVVLQVENRSRILVPWVLIEDLLPRKALVFDPPCLDVTGTRLKLALVTAHGRLSLLYQMKCNRRGYYQIGPLVLETGELFGLHRRFRVATSPHFLMVLPRVIPLAGFDIASRRPIGEVRMAHRLYEDPTRIAGVRRYESGDPLNRVHWRATARTGTLHSKLYEPSSVAGATILLDFHQTKYRRQDEPHRSELAITAVASVANALYEMSQQVGLVTNGRDAADRIRHEGWNADIRSRKVAHQGAAMHEQSDRLQPLVVQTRRGPEQITRILEALARLELTDGLELSQLVGETIGRMPRDATVIAVVPRVTTETTILLDNVRQRGFAVTAILNLHDQYEFAQAAGPLLACGIKTHHLKDEQHVVTICRNLVLR